jgi:hypothetical protein
MIVPLYDHAHSIDLDRHSVAERHRSIARARPAASPGLARRTLGAALVAAGSRLLRVHSPTPATGRDPCA